MSKQLADNQDLLAMTHVGEDPEKYMKSVTPPIFMNSLHVFDTVKDYFDVDIFKDEFYYGRASNPTVAVLCVFCSIFLIATHGQLNSLAA